MYNKYYYIEIISMNRNHCTCAREHNSIIIQYTYTYIRLRGYIIYYYNVTNNTYNMRPVGTYNVHNKI